MNKCEAKELIGMIFDFGSEAEKTCTNTQAFRQYRRLIIERYAEKLVAVSPEERGD